ncbi:putative uncharacterized protein C3orf49 [Xenopus laevis]|nr:putative uncharacterized protein C3orf49 [Xenopus laevis]
MQNPTYSSGPRNVTCHKGNNPEQKAKVTHKHKGKGIVRWHGAVSTNLPKQNVLTPTEDSASDSESLLVPNKKKKSFGQKMKAVLGKVVSAKASNPKQTKAQSPGTGCSPGKDSPISPTQIRLTKIMKHLPLPREIPKGLTQGTSHPATLQLDINVVEAESQRLTADSVVVRSRRMTRRVSVTSVPSGLQKGPYQPKKKHFAFAKKSRKPVEKVRYHPGFTVGNLQMQVDDLIETIAEKSTKLLEQRHEELRQCESLGDEILQSSKQFQRVTKKTTRKYRLRDMCFPCICCWCCCEGR